MTEVPQPDVVVVCNDPSHEARTVKVGNFTHCDITELRPDIWGELPSGSRWQADLFALLELGPKMQKRVNDGVETLAGSQPAGVIPELPTIESLQPGLDNDIRIRFSMKCDLCGLHVVARYEAIGPILDKLAANGVDSIELAHLAAIVT